MKFYLNTIKNIQQILLTVGVVILLILPSLIVFKPELVTHGIYDAFFLVSHVTLLLVMIVRPLADIFTKVRFIRPLVILRKGLGVVSASIIVALLLARVMVDPVGFGQEVVTLEYWSLLDLSFLAHVADIAAVILLVTSNNLSKKLLGWAWKKIQKLAYVYFYFSALYVYLVFGDQKMLVFVVIVTLLTFVAFLRNRLRDQVIS